MNAFDALLCVAREEWRAAGAPRRVLIAVSGGADSTGLARVLDALSREARLTLAAAHIDHGLREDSPIDAAFVASLCQTLGIPCAVDRLSLGRGDENAARQARYAALAERAKAFDADVIALAHHENDQAETVLMRLARGAGGDGLGGMAALRTMNGLPCPLWRPFLTVSPGRIRDALREIGQAWREDATNQTDDYFRNRVRRHVLPVLESGAPGAARAIARAARVLADESDCLNALADDYLAARASLSPPCVFLETDGFEALHPAIRRRAVRRLCGRAGIDADYALTERLLSLRAGEQCNLPRDYRAERTAARLHITPPVCEPLPLSRIETSPFTGDTGDGIRTQAIPLGAMDGARLRRRLPGDVIQPLGMKGTKSLQDYFVDRKIDRPFRDHLPLLCRDGEVLWAIGAGVSERLRVEPGAPAVYCRYLGRIPSDTKEAAEHGQDGGDVQGY